MSNFWALLIGINDYQAVPKLRGCVQDVEGVRDFLVRNLAVPEGNITMLLDGAANRAGIIQALDDLANDNRITSGDQIFIHYSGHGSQMRDTTGLEPDGYNETLVAWDSRLPGTPDIPDKVLGALLDQLVARKGENVTVFLDCCHSGSGTRKANTDADAPLSRQAPPDGAPPALPESDLQLIQRAAGRTAGPSGWASGGIPYTLFAACRDDEEANEYRASDEAGNYMWSGAFTYFMLQAMRQMGPSTSYAQLYDQVAVKVNTRYPTQLPLCEGNRDREVFGSRPVQRDPFIRVRQQNGELTLEAGMIHDLQLGAKLAVYPLSVNTRDEAAGQTPLATVEVTSVAATSAKAQLLTGQIAEEATHALITEQAYSGQRQSLALKSKGGAANDDALRRLADLIAQTAPAGQKPPYLDVLADPSQPADLRVIAEDGRLTIYNRNLDELVLPEDIEDGGGDVAAVLNSLQSIARYRNILALTNQDGSSQLQGKIKVGFRQLLDGEGQPLPAGAINEGGEITLTYDPENADNNLYVVDVTNTSGQEVYPYVLLVNADYSLSILYPQSGQQDVLKPGNTLPIGLGRGQDPLEVYLPEEGDGLDLGTWDYSHDYIKVIATTTPTDFKVLEQDGLNVAPPAPGGRRAVGSPLDELIDTVAGGAGKRLARRKRAEAGEDWATVELAYSTVRGSQTRSIQPGTVEVGDGLVVQAPAGFSGSVTVTTLGQAKRGVDSESGLKLPPGLGGVEHLLQPVSRKGTRSVGSTALMLEFGVDEASRQAVTEANPLKIGLPSEPGEAAEFMPIVFDGEDYLPVGFTSEDGSGVEIVNLPEAKAGPSKRGIGRTIKLLLYKKAGRYTSLTGLRYLQEENGKREYTEIDRSVFKPGDKVALMVHGFTSDTSWMKNDLAGILQDKVGAGYDHFITWDYETFGTPIKETAEDLANALRQKCGFGPEDEMTLHVYAHSMGSIVSRTMIELKGGHEFVDGLVIAGPPNRGTTLATVGMGGVYGLTTLLNSYNLVPPVAAVNWGIKQIYGNALGPADLKVDSELLREINGLQEPANVPYLVIAGRNVPTEKQTRLAQKILDKTLDTIFGEDNDIVIGLSSLREVRGGGYPKLRVMEVPCDHFAYYGLPEVQAEIKAWLATL